jgi:hypothetical protein
MMTKQQFEREQERRARDAELSLLATARATADPRYVAEAAGWWLRMSKGDSRPERNFRMRPDLCARC